MKAEIVLTLYTSATKACVCVCVCLSFSSSVSEISLWYLNEKSHSLPNTDSRYNTEPYNNTLSPSPLMLPTLSSPSFFLVPPSFFFFSLPLVSILYCSLTSFPGFVTPRLYLCVCVCAVCLQLKFPDAASFCRGGDRRLHPWPLDP